MHQLVCPTFALVYHLRRVGVNLACCGCASMAVLGRVRWTRPALPVRVALGHFFVFVLNAAVVIGSAVATADVATAPIVVATSALATGWWCGRPRQRCPPQALARRRRQGGFGGAGRPPEI